MLYHLQRNARTIIKNVRRKHKKISNIGGCSECEICKEVNILVEHHIRGRKIDKPNHPSNLSYVCSNCHAKIHHGIIIVENRLLTTNGYVLIWHSKDEESITKDDAKPHLITQKKITK
jgi:hypothetical protein